MKKLVIIQNKYYKMNALLEIITEEKLFKLDPIAETQMSLALEDNEEFQANLNDLIRIECVLPDHFVEECDVLYVKVWIDNKLVLKSIELGI